MPKYFVAGYLPDDFDPSQMDEAVGREIHALNKEMIAAGVRKFACGLGAAKSLRAQTDGRVVITDGPYLETKEHIGGFWILECADMDEAVAWARKGVAATRGQGEVREYEINARPLHDPQGRVTAILSIARDVTVRREAERARQLPGRLQTYQL